MNTELVLEQYARYLRKCRISRKWTQADLAQEAGVSVRSVSRIELGYSCDLSTFIRILNALAILDQLSAVFSHHDTSVNGDPARQRFRRSEHEFIQT